MATSAVDRKCPFCSSSIDEEILLYGGSCPKCFGVIPGEEAATDPGAVVRARQAASDTRRMWWKALVPVVLAVPAVGAVFVIAVGFVIWNRNPTVETMNFDDEGIGVEYEIVSAPPEVVEPVPGKAKVRPGPRPVGSDGNDGVADGNVPPTRIDVPPTPQPAGAGSGGLSFDGLGVQAFREGETLSDPGQIYQMVKMKMTGFQGQLKECYDRRLKVKPDLEGRWLAKFMIGVDGYPQDVGFRGMNMQDAELEKCLADKVKRWRFNKITQPQPVEKSWRFRPG